jgi:Ser/Thr protein kinase RdoA (MazF antagonist)
MGLDALSRWLVASYDLEPPVACRLLRSYTNDVYEVRSRDRRFVLKVYGLGWRTEAEARYEVALLRHLFARGLPIAGPVPRCSGDPLGTLEATDGCRLAVLYEWAPGDKPEPPFSPMLYRAFGRAVARMHTLSDDFVTAHPRRPLDLDLLIHEPLALAVPLLTRRGDREFLRKIAEEVKQRIAALAPDGLDWGPIHGDATLDNRHVTPDGEITLYDFDSGGPGWKAADLQGWAAGSAEYCERWDAFQQGYQSVRPVRPADLQAAPYLTVVWDIWGIRIDLENRILRQGRERTAAYLDEQIAAIRERVQAVATFADSGGASY